MLHIVALYERLKRDASAAVAPRCFVFGGKAAPGYRMAKLMIRLINGVAERVNSDPQVSDRLKVVFLPDFNVKNAHFIYPAADLSEQISTAGKEASGTGNMKFAINGALTIGTLDGANVEIREAVGAENFFLFGMTVEDVQRRLARGYRPHDHYESDEELRAVVDAISDGAFSNGDRELFKPIVANLLGSDPYMLLADYRSYVDHQEEVGRVWRDPERWTRSSILNVARMGRFSSDRSIHEYCRVAIEKIALHSPNPTVDTSPMRTPGTGRPRVTRSSRASVEVRTTPMNTRDAASTCARVSRSPRTITTRITVITTYEATTGATTATGPSARPR